jgi:predicted small integral membrane protein
MWIRFVKIVLVALAGLYAAVAAFNNITDYGSNFQFVAHVLRMDTTFPDNALSWRAISSPALQHAAYALIIATETAVAALAFNGVLAMWRSRFEPAMFNRSKRLAGLALTLGICLWFGGFVIVGGEWFLMWQSAEWNGVESAFRIAAFFSIVLLFLTAEDKGFHS